VGVRGEGSNPADGYRVGVPDVDFCGTRECWQDPFLRIFHGKWKLLKQDERIIAVGTRKIATQKMQRLQK
jgi:hypothetical protein